MGKKGKGGVKVGNGRGNVRGTKDERRIKDRKKTGKRGEERENKQDKDGV